MARSTPTFYDWSIFEDLSSRLFLRTRGQQSRKTTSRFPLELDAHTIVCPHLYDYQGEQLREADDRYTHIGQAAFTLFVGRGPEQLRYLRDELAPAVTKHVPLVLVVDGEGQRFTGPAPLVEGALPLRQLPEVLWDYLRKEQRTTLTALVQPFGQAAFLVEGPEAVMPVVDKIEAFNHALSLRAQGGEVPQKYRALLRDIPRRYFDLAESYPIRLWEFLFFRGHGYRYELVNDEVPLVGNLLTESAADKTLAQCVADAARLTGQRPVNTGGWTLCGSFRLRRCGAHVEVRVRLTAADRLVAFAPQRIEPVSALPSLQAALLAGCEGSGLCLDDGWTHITFPLRGLWSGEELAGSFRRTIDAWCAARVVVDKDVDEDADARPLQDAGPEDWRIRYSADHLSIYVPFSRAEGLLFGVAMEDWV